MIESIKHSGLTWINIKNISESDTGYLARHFKLNQNILKELRQNISRPHIDDYGEYFYMVLHFPLFNEKERRTYAQEFDCIVTKKIIVTSSPSDFELLDAIFQKVKTDLGLKEQYFNKDTSYLLHYIATLLLDMALRELDHIKINIDKAQEKVFQGKEKEMVQEISIISYDILNFRRTILPQRPVIESLIKIGPKFFGGKSKLSFDDLTGKFVLILDYLENQKEAAESLQNTTASLLSTKTNDIIKTLTVITSIMFTLSFIADFVIMNAAAGQLVNNLAFWATATFMTAVAVILLIMFKQKKWF